MALNENINDYNRLEELGGSDYEIADGQPDIRGWSVRDDDGRSIGEVEELIFNPASQKVRYMVIDLDVNDFDVEERDVLIPIGVASLDEREDEVIVPGITTEQLLALPEYEKGNITASSESAIRGVFTGAGATGIAAGTIYEERPEDFYEHEHFDEERFYGKRRSSEVPVIPVTGQGVVPDDAELVEPREVPLQADWRSPAEDRDPDAEPPLPGEDDTFKGTVRPDNDKA